MKRVNLNGKRRKIMDEVMNLMKLDKTDETGD